MVSEKQHIGQQAEQAACHFLVSQGLSLLDKNYSCSQGEIDLIMEHNDTLVFVEVRFRHNTRFGTGAETVGWRKQNKLLAAAAHYLQKNTKLAKKSCRFDVVSMTSNNTGGHKLDWITDAFQSV